MGKLSGLVISLLVLLSIESCKDAGPNPGLVVPPGQLIGIWQSDDSHPPGSSKFFQRVVSPSFNSEWFSFNGDGTMTESIHVTAPTDTYLIEQGKWALADEASIEMTLKNGLGYPYCKKQRIKGIQTNELELDSAVFVVYSTR